MDLLGTGMGLRDLVTFSDRCFMGFGTDQGPSLFYNWNHPCPCKPNNGNGPAHQTWGSRPCSHAFNGTGQLLSNELVHSPGLEAASPVGPTVGVPR